MSKNAIALFPYIKEIYPYIIHFSELFPEHNLMEVCTFKHSSLYMKDIAYPVNYPCSSFLVKALEEIDVQSLPTVLCPQPYSNKGFNNPKIEKNTARCLEDFLNKGGKVICCVSSNTTISSEMTEVIRNYPESVELCAKDNISELHFNQTKKKHKTTEVPVILVGALMRSHETANILLSLRHRLQKRGVKISSFVNSPISRITELHTVADIFHNNSLSEADKILRINERFYSVVCHENPQLVLVEAPDPLIQYNDYAINNYGIQSYMLSNAVRINGIVLDLPYLFFNKNFLEALNRKLEERLNAPVIANYASNIIIDTLDTNQTYEMSLLHVPLEKMYNHFSQHWDKLQSQAKYFIVEYNDDVIIDDIFNQITRNKHE